MFLSVTTPKGVKSGEATRNLREDRAVRFGQSLGIVLVTPNKNQHR
jgi:hypothetical protein